MDEGNVFMANILDVDIIVTKFKLQLNYYIYSQTNTQEKKFTLRNYGLNSTTIVLWQGLIRY